MVGATAAASWGSCRFCGTAVAPGATACGLCGADRPIAAGQLARAPAPVRRRVALTNWLRALIVVGVAVGLAWTLLDSALTGPPAVPDPLTTTGTYAVPTGSTAILSGAVTGGDYVVGNFTTVAPYLADVTLAIYTSQAWRALVDNGTVSSPAWSAPSEGSGRIIFSALYTTNYTFVLTNAYPASAHLNLTVYVATDYESNVGDDGFG